MSREIVKVYAPATVANVACGFDILGFAVAKPGDHVIARRTDTPGVVVKSISGDGGKLPLDSKINTASVAAEAFLNYINEKKFGIEIELLKGMPLGSGLGSSAASSAAGAFAANLLFGEPLKREALVQFAMQGEEIACGSAHADNVAPALLGGFVLIRSYSPLDIVKIPCPDTLFCSIVHPHVEVRTADARRILRKEITLKNAITQWGNIAGLVAGLLLKDTGLIGRSLEDVIIEPERALLIPGFSNIKESAINNGALGCSISGSGPSIFAISDNQTTAEVVGRCMREESEAIGLQSDLFISPINHNGAQEIPL